MIDPKQLFSRVQSQTGPVRPIALPGQSPPAMRLDQVSLQVSQTGGIPAVSNPDGDETLPENLLKEGFITKLMFGLKAPLDLFKSKDPKQIVATNHTDTHGNTIRLSREASVGFNKIVDIAKQRGIKVEVVSSYRSTEQQKYLWEKALKKYGSATAARKWVAPPGKSRHQHGNAIDMHMYRNGKRVKQSEFDEIIAKAGMYRPMSYETWHVEPLSTQAERKGPHHDHDEG